MYHLSFCKCTLLKTRAKVHASVTYFIVAVVVHVIIYNVLSGASCLTLGLGPLFVCPEFLKHRNDMVKHVVNVKREQFLPIFERDTDNINNNI